ncbi:TRAP transporter substrate-binding protein DctP [Myxococcota bacterium]|nr:TRAP transporter substrate-binding protein DctP [Myxococcota bacterium]
MGNSRGWRVAGKGLVIAAVLAWGGALRAEPVVIKLATVAPKGSPWMNAYTAMNEEVEKATEGRVSFKFYPGMVSGDEKDMVRKMRAGQLHAGGLTGTGLQMIQPAMLVWQLPLLFKDYEELAKTRARMEDRMQGLMNQKGFVILGWSDLGYTYIFTKKPASSLASFNQIKMWGWEDEPISKAFFEVAGIAQVPLALTDVLPGLQRGMIDGVYNSLMGLMSLQWDKYVSYVTKLVISIGIGATVVTKSVWDQISPEDQKRILEISRRHHDRLNGEIQKKNKEALSQMKKAGMQVVDLEAGEMERFQGIAARVRQMLTGKFFDAALLKDVEAMRDRVRAGN